MNFLHGHKQPPGRCRIRMSNPATAILITIVLPFVLGQAQNTHAQDSLNVLVAVESPALMDLVGHGRLAPRPGRPRIALALSGGGARGLAQVGVLRAFEEAGISVDIICGVSMGAIVGGLYACGLSPDSLEALARNVRWGELLRNTPPRAQLLLSQKDKEANWFVSIPMRDFRPQLPTGATSGQLLYNYLSKLTRGATYRSRADFDQLPLRYRAIATELLSGKPVAFDRGEVGLAMRAAMAFPLAVTPLRRDTLLYADGGLVNPLPVDVTASLSEFPVVAVNTATGLVGAKDLTDPYAVASQATTVMTAPYLRHSLDAADYVCKPELGEITNYDFDALDTLFAAGYRAGIKVADEILRDHYPGEMGCDSISLARTGYLTLTESLSLNDCPSDIAARVSSGEALSLCAAQRLVELAIASGWWESARLFAANEEVDETAEWVLWARRPPVLQSIEFSELKVFEDSTLRQVMALSLGTRHDRWAIATALNRIVDFYAGHDYALTDISNATLSDAGVLTVTVDEALLARVVLSGNKKVKSWVVLRNFPLKPGAPYNAREVERGLNDLQASGLFEQVTTEVERTDNGPLLRLTVTEKTADAIHLGLRHNLEYQTEVFVEWASVNLLGLGNELIVHAQHAPRRDWFFVRASADRVFRTYLTSALTAYRHRHERRRYQDHDQIGTFTTDRFGVEFFFGQHIARKAQMALTLNVEDLDLDVTPDPTEHVNVARLALWAKMDDLDDRDFPTEGRRLSAQLRWADDFLGGEIVYRAFDGEGTWVVSPRDRVTLQTTARFATAERILPIYERFSLGGLHSFMGLNDDEFLGDKLVQASFLGRYQFYTRSYAGVRLDIGTVWDHNAYIDFVHDLRVGIGGGFMFDTPLGPLLIMGGIAEDNYSKFYFSWGYEF